MSRSAGALDTGHHLGMLREMRSGNGSVGTQGLPEDAIAGFLADDGTLAKAIERGYAHYRHLRESRPALVQLDEAEQVRRIQEGYVNFYPQDAVNPYVAAGAAGPWIVTLKGAVVYDCGGYGMLGLGHSPDAVLATLNRPEVMANIMTANVSQMNFLERLRKELGHTRAGGCPFDGFLCMNSGSEAVSVASRIADIGTRQMTDPGGRYEGRDVVSLTLRGSFHGRTDRPARHSDSTLGKYREYLASYRDVDWLLTVEPNDVAGLEQVFARAEDEALFIEAFFMEPVMGEGNPGQAVTPEFYKRARELTEAHGTLFLVDSIQAGLRAHGVLSIVDYPGFGELPPPDMETWSKALNGGQYPLSVLGLSGRASTIYRAGLYGNTMTSNPRALNAASVVLEELTPDLRENIRRRGRELVAGFRKLAAELDGPITRVQGTGLLASCELDKRYKCYGVGSTEEYLRRRGLGVIHGGTNSLRYTPWFRMTSAEVDLIVDLTREALLNGPTLE